MLMPDQMFLRLLLLSSSLNFVASLSFIKPYLGKTLSVKFNGKFTIDWSYRLDNDEQVELIKFHVLNNKRQGSVIGYKRYGQNYTVKSEIKHTTAEVDDVSKAKLSIMKVTDDNNNSEYTCEITAKSGEYSDTVKIKVIRPPVFTATEDLLKEVVEGSSLSLQCKATGDPEPQVRWIQKSSNKTFPNTNGILEFESINRNDSGYYFCKANNSAGVAYTGLTNVIVKYPPKINETASSKPVVQTFKDNPDQVILACVADSVPLSNYSWRNPKGFIISHQSLYKLRSTNEDIYGKYICTVQYENRQVKHTVDVQEVTQPDPPVIKLEELMARSLAISITLPTKTGGNSIEKIHIVRNDENGALFKETISAVSISQQYRMTELTPYTNYTINVTVENKFLNSNPATLTAKTAEAKPGAPSSVILNVKSTKTIIVTWSPPLQPNGKITKYRYKFYPTDQTTFENVSSSPIELDKRQERFDNLTFYTRYSFAVQASTSIGYGEWSPIVTNYTDARPPTAPLNLKVTRQKFLLKIFWEEPSDTGGGHILKYNIKINGTSKEKGVKFKEINLSSDMTGNRESTIDNIQPYSVVNVYVREGSGVKPIWGNYSKPFQIEIPQGVPEKPQGLTVLDKTAHEIHLQWLRPIRVNGKLLKFTVAFKELPDGEKIEEELKHQPGKTTFDHTIKSLKPETKYHIVVYAHSEFYRSSPSNSQETTTRPSIVTPVPIHDKGSNTGAIIGGVISALLLLILSIVFFLYISFRRKKREISRPRSENSETGFIKLDQTEKKSLENLSYTDFGNDFAINTKNERRFTLTRPIKLTGLKDYIEKQHSNIDKGFIDEFESCQPEGDFTCNESIKTENKKKNRYANILACLDYKINEMISGWKHSHYFQRKSNIQDDHSRVVLNTVENLSGSDYVNANYIDGYEIEKKFIATQGPVDATFPDFWRMVWEQKTKIIIMVTNLIEKGRAKCQKYWPSSPKGHVYGNIKVVMHDEVELANYVVRGFSLTRVKNGEESASRKVVQYQFTSWPDHGVPLFSSQILQFLRRIRNEESKGAPTVIHCSAGIGRTGTYITLDAMLDQIEKEKQVDIFGCVSHIRSQRKFMVQTEPQYIFIYHALLEYISCGNTETKTADFPTKIKHLNTINPGTTQTFIHEEFGRISVNLDESAMHVEAALLPCNIDKNRFPDILPYELSRVKLWPYPDVEGSDYINASFVDGYQLREAYILTQAPLENTIQDFWRMLWEYEIFSCVMISSEKERDMHHCYPYWPMNDEAANFGLLRVQITSEEDKPPFVKREFQVSNTKSGETRVLTHFMYYDWPAEGPVDATAVNEMIGMLLKTQQATGNNSILIHCSDGSGRSGTLAALMYCLERLNLEGSVDVFQAVRVMRTQRANVVQTLSQYQFIHAAIRKYLEGFSDYSNFK